MMSATVEQRDGVVILSEDNVGKALPLIIRAAEGRNSVECLKQWMLKNKDWLAAKMLRHGAILLKGFDVNAGSEFQDVIQQFCPELCDEYRGTSPRKLVPGTQYVFTASELPAFFPISQHLEMSFLPAPPRQLFFCCLEAPTSLGGETCLSDFKAVYDQLDPQIRKQFEDKGVIHARNYNFKKSLLSDPTALKGWPEVFNTDSREEVNAELRRQGIDHSWGPNNSLRIVNKQAAVEEHPVTGDKIWFNHLLIFHWSMVYQEYYRIWGRLGQLKALFLALLGWLLSFFFLTVRGPNSVGTHTTFGDGSTIPDKTIAHVRDTVWKNMVFNRWEKGDILMIDNFRVSHGRQPYSGKRKIVVSWSMPRKKPSCVY